MPPDLNTSFEIQQHSKIPSREKIRSFVPAKDYSNSKDVYMENFEKKYHERPSKMQDKTARTVRQASFLGATPLDELHTNDVRELEGMEQTDGTLTNLPLTINKGAVLEMFLSLVLLK